MSHELVELILHQVRVAPYRPAVALALPFVTEVWEVHLLIFVLQSASAAFTRTFQATIPDVLADEKEYTRALSLSRLAYDLESVVSPVLPAALLTVISFHNCLRERSSAFWHPQRLSFRKSCRARKQRPGAASMIARREASASILPHPACAGFWP